VIRMCSQGARDVHLAAQDRLKAFRLALLPVLDRPEHVAEVGERDGFHSALVAALRELRHLHRWLTETSTGKWTWRWTNSVTEAPFGLSLPEADCQDCVGAAERRAREPACRRKMKKREESPVSPQIHRPCPGATL